MADSNPIQTSQAHPFNYQYQRFMIGFVALMLPILVAWFGCPDLTSLSFSYHSDVRDMFVVCIAAVGALMIPYQGRTGNNKWEFWVPKFGGICAIMVGYMPMDCISNGNGGWIAPFDCFISSACGPTTNGMVHLMASIGVFLSLFILCIIFRHNAKGKHTFTGSLRACIYEACMFGILVGAVLAGAERLGFPAFGERTIFWAETVMLVSFSIAWLTASKIIIREKH